MMCRLSTDASDDDIRGLCVDDGAAMAAARASPQGQRVAADVVNYATGGAVIIHYPVQDGTG